MRGFKNAVVVDRRWRRSIPSPEAKSGSTRDCKILRLFAMPAAGYK
jgi:hypothetical protein